jgi:hypothetical protein
MNLSVLTDQSNVVIYFLSHMQSLLQHGCGEVWAPGEGGDTKAVKNGMGMGGDQFNWYIKKCLEVICKN